MRLRKRKWVDPLINSDKDFIIKNTFDYDNFILEIGMGMGDFIIESATLNPDLMYIGLEKDRTCVGRVIRKLKELNINNVKVLLADAALLQDLVKEKSVKHIYLHFSDPWPKKHHHKRRLTYPSFLSLYEKILKDDGYITFKTDNDLLFEDSLLYVESSNFKIIDKNINYHSIKREEPMTAYERKFVESGVPIKYMLLKKN